MNDMSTLEGCLRQLHARYMTGDIDESFVIENDMMGIKLEFPQILELWEHLGLVVRQ